MTEARKRAADIAANIEAKAARLPEGTRATIRSAWESASAGAFGVDVRINVFSTGADVEFHVDGRTKHARYILDGDRYYTSLNWSEAECIHLCKTGTGLLSGIDRLACEMMVD